MDLNASAIRADPSLRDSFNLLLFRFIISGNGEIDFDEFLLLMTNTERFIESLGQ